jgi:predicted DsbA family dithiol-disulfide isomerase
MSDPLTSLNAALDGRYRIERALGDTATGPTVHLEVFSDYTCPWCYVGWARLESALSRVPEGVTVDVHWRPYEIHAEVPPEGMPVEDLPYSPEQWARMQEALRRSAAEEGLEVGKRPKVSNTHRALMAGEYARVEEPDSFAAFHEALFKGYFAEGRDLGERYVVEDIARSSGLDVERMTRALDAGEYEDAITATTATARQLGITGTPTFVFDRRFAAVGAQPAEALLQAIEAALKHTEED